MIVGLLYFRGLKIVTFLGRLVWWFCFFCFRVFIEGSGFIYGVGICFGFFITGWGWFTGAGGSFEFVGVRRFVLDFTRYFLEFYLTFLRR